MNDRNVPLTDFITRKVHNIIRQKEFDAEEEGGSMGRSKIGGSINIDVPGQQVLHRNSVVVNTDWVEARISIALPARGRTILGDKALRVLTTSLHYVVQNALHFNAYSAHDVEAFVASIEDQDILRDTIVDQGGLKCCSAS